MASRRRSSAASSWRGAGRAGVRSRATGGARSATRRRSRPERRRTGARPRRSRRAGLGRARRPERAPRCSKRAADLFEQHTRRADGADRPRRRPHHPGGAVRSARGGRFPALLRGARPRRFRRARTRLPGPTGERNQLDAARPRRFRLHLRRGISRWRSSPARSPPRSPPATRSSPSRPSRRR